MRVMAELARAMIFDTLGQRFAFVIALTLTGCGGVFPKTFREPRTDEPHARLNLEVIHAARPGPHVRDEIALNGRMVRTLPNIKASSA